MTGRKSASFVARSAARASHGVRLTRRALPCAKPRIKPLTLSLVLLSLTVSAAGCKLLKRGQGGDSDPGAETTTSGETKAKPSAGCALPEGSITSEVTLKKGCTVTVNEHVVIEKGGVLKVEPGVKMLFAPNTYLDVAEGKLSIVGTEKEPVTLTSASTTRAAGDWAGVFVGEGVTAGSEITFARIEYAGADAHGCRGALTIQNQKSGKRLAITNTTFANNDRAAIASDSEKALFAKFERNVFKANKISLSAPAAVLGSVGAGNTFGDPIETFGDVKENTSWGAFGVPIQVKDHIAIASEAGAPVLTIAPGSTLKFAAGTYLSVGETKGGGLVAPKVTFTSANATPHPGDWAGLFFYKRTSNVNLEGATIEHAGQDAHGARAALTFYDVAAKDARGFKLTGLTVKSTEHAAMASTDHDCGELGKQISAQGVALCRKD